jgi:hypothetical protein
MGKEKVYENDPEWVKKSIVYFCRNYTIDGEDLSKKAKEALKAYRNDREKGTTDIDTGICWVETSLRFDFWASLWYLSTGEERRMDQSGDCKPWTRAEKRLINKMPSVK